MRVDWVGAAPCLVLLLCACSEVADQPSPSASAPGPGPVGVLDAEPSASTSASAGWLSPLAPVITHEADSVPPPKPPPLDLTSRAFPATIWRNDSKGFVATNGHGIVVHTLAGAKNVTIPKGQKGNILIALTPKGDRIAQLDAVGVTRVWETATGKLIAEVPTVGETPISLAFAPDGSAVAANGTSFVIWDIAKKAERCRRESVRDGGLVFTDDAQYVLGTSGGNWSKSNAQTCEQKGEGGVRTGGMFGSWIDPRGRWLSAAEPDGHGLALYDARTLKPIEALAQSIGCKDHISMGYFSTDGEVLLGAGGTTWFRSFRVSSKKTIASYDIPKPDEVTALVPFDDGERLYVVRGQRATLVSAVSKQEVTSFDLEGDSSLSVSPDGKVLLGISGDKVKLRDTLTGKVTATVELPKS